MRGMTDEMREEAIRELETIKMCEVDTVKQVQALDLAITALRGPTREMVERMRGKWISYLDGEHIMPDRYYKCSKCSSRGYRRRRNFCPACGAPMTDEAVDILWQRWKEALGENT